MLYSVTRRFFFHSHKRKTVQKKRLLVDIIPIMIIFCRYCIFIPKSHPNYLGLLFCYPFIFPVPTSTVLNNFTIHTSIPNNFANYQVSNIDEMLENSTRMKKFQIYAPGVKYLPKNRHPLAETSYTFNLKTKHLHVYDVFVSGYCAFGRGKNMITLNDGVDLVRLSFPIHIVGNVSQAIALAHTPLYISRLFYNFMFVIFSLPEPVIQSSVFIVPDESYEKHAKPLFEIVFPGKQILPLRKNEFVNVEEFHTVFCPSAGIQHYSFSLLKCSQIIKEKFNLTSIQPSFYGYSNRKLGYARVIANFDSLVKEILRKYPDYNWINVPDHFDNFSKSFKIWASLKVIFAATGSNLIPLIAMKEESGLCIVGSDRLDWEVVALTQVCNLFLYYVGYPGIPHFDRSPKTIDINVALETLGDVIYAVNNGHWSSKTIELNKGFQRKFVPYPR